MALLAAQTVVRNGIAPALVPASAGGDTFENDGTQWIQITNGDGTPTALTIVTPRTVDGLAVADKQISIPAGSTRLIGPFPVGTYNNNDNEVALQYDKVTSLTIGVFVLSSS